MNLYTPERQEGESQRNYKERRAIAKAAVRAMTLAGIGDQRKLPGSREQLRDAQRSNGNGPSGIYSQGLVQPQRKRDQRRMAWLHRQRDEFGAFTKTGRNPRRIWLAGISAQRGF